MTDHKPAGVHRAAGTQDVKRDLDGRAGGSAGDCALLVLAAERPSAGPDHCLRGGRRWNAVVAGHSAVPTAARKLRQLTAGRLFRVLRERGGVAGANPTLKA